MSARMKAYLLLLATAIVWGAAGPVIKYTTNYLPPFIFLLYRFGISSVLILLTFSTWKKSIPRHPKQLWQAIIYGFLITTVVLSMLFWGYSLTNSLVGTFFSAIFPLLASAAGVIFLHEHVTHREKLGIGIAILGTLLIVLEPIIFGQSSTGSSLLGNILIISAHFIEIITSISAKVLLRLKTDPNTLTNISFLTGFVTIIPLTLALHSPTTIVNSITTAPPLAHLGVIFMALISGVIAYNWWHKAQKTIEVGEASLSYYLHPVFAAPFSLLWLGESVSLIFVLGAFITTLGVIVAELKSRPSSSPKKAKRSA